MKLNKTGRNIRKNEQGITLIALVVTIIILIILAGVSINLVLGDNGIVNKAKDGRNNYQVAANEEDVTMKTFANEIASLGNGESATPTVTLLDVQKDDMLTKTTNSTYTDLSYSGTNKTVTIPAGYKMTTDSTKIEDGIVIEDSTGNQWVWIPVNEAMAETITATELGGSGKSGVTTTLKSKSELITGKTRVNIGATMGRREPDIATNYDKSDNASTYLKDAGFTNSSTALVNFATDLKNSYKAMIESVEYYGGFYVGRYEITGTLANPTEKQGWAITGTSNVALNNIGGEQEANWYKLYNACSKFTTSSATSRMIWGCTWDEICKYIANKGYTDENSGTFGNYYDVSVKASDGVTEIKAASIDRKLQTGITTFTKTCNIYDLAGNCYELTQEVWNTDNRDSRGRLLWN